MIKICKNDVDNGLFLHFSRFFILTFYTSGILGSLQTTTLNTTSISVKLDIGISSEVSGARVLYDTKINSDDRTRAYGDIKDDHSTYHIKDDSEDDCKNSSSSSSRRIIHNENNENIEDSVNVYIDHHNLW